MPQPRVGRHQWRVFVPRRGGDWNAPTAATGIPLWPGDVSTPRRIVGVGPLC